MNPEPAGVDTSNANANEGKRNEQTDENHPVDDVVGVHL